MPAAFSRLQLAAALLEYDNDPTDPTAPVRRAQDSAIFAHFRRNPAAPPQMSSRRSDYLGVSLPSEAGSLGGRESALDNRRSRASRGSLDALRNPFGMDDHWEDEEDGIGEEAELEVDLASWGLDALMPKDKGKSAKGKGKATMLPPHPVSSVRSHFPMTKNDAATTIPRRAINTSRSMSMGGLTEHPELDSRLLENDTKRRRSFGSPLDLVGMEISLLPIQRPRGSSYSASRPLTSASPSVPFPSSSARSPSPRLGDDIGRRMSTGSRLDRRNTIDRRTFSRASIDSKVIFEERDEVAESLRRVSGETSCVAEPAADNPFAIRPPSPSRLSRFDPKASAHARTFSTASKGSKVLLEQDDVPLANDQDHPRSERRYSTTLELLRPKVLVMPSPLQRATPEAPLVQNQVRDGFLLSKDGPPLPPGARSTRRSSTTMSILDSSNKAPIASNSFTPNPLMNLSLSQMTFRNTLSIGDQRDPYSDDTGGLPRAMKDGEQVEFEPPESIENELFATSPSDMQLIASENNRPAGKLFGKSLIDDLELRKAQMRGKQRVFTGDQRPSMMTREQTRSSTLIDPATLNNRTAPQRQSSYGLLDSKQAISRRNSLNAKPLINFDDESDRFKLTTATTRMASSRSVFGVDALWEREMAKLREIQAQEEQDAEDRKKKEEQEEQKRRRKNKKKNSKAHEKENSQPEMEVTVTAANEHRASIEPPVLPDIKRATRPPPQVAEDDSESADSDDEIAAHAGTDAGKWFSDSDSDGPRRTTGVGPRYPNKVRHIPKAEDADSEEDLPLSVAVNRAVQRATQLKETDDSDEEKPLSALLQKAKSGLPTINFDPLSAPNAEDDDKPLGLRASRLMNSSHRSGQDDDDDQPLAFHPEQQRRTQYQMMAQQQLMMQAQFQNSMFFSPPSMLGSGFYGPPLMPGMMMPPSMPASPPPVHDEVKFGRVDKWRHDVAVEGGR
ncbi:hypothetical protein AX17_000970 [Amanita inopinata Kibby_2008]|nr:hypothetical protein AX17_000970 [Amanita inopinata Kibby_2008]